jgi:hypothetical protein
MKSKTFFSLFVMLFIIIASGRAQTTSLYVFGGTSGIGNSVISGNIGIGTNAPVARLHVANGNIKLEGYIEGTQNNCALKIKSNGGYVIIGAQTTSYCDFYTDRPAYRFDKPILAQDKIVLANGNLTTSFSVPLVLSTGYNSRLTFETRSSHSFATFNADHVYMQNGKWFGFAPVDPDDGRPSENTPRLVLTHTGTHGYIDYQDNLHFRANHNWISALTCYGDGTVGIGFETTYALGDYRVPSGYKLGVNGGIICEEVKVIDDVPDADYVFENDYELMPLSDLQKFVNSNKHLPDIPSAQQFKEDGYKVGEMDELLLKKIEELTLYVIQLKQENDDLKAMISSEK